MAEIIYPKKRGLIKVKRKFGFSYYLLIPKKLVDTAGIDVDKAKVELIETTIKPRQLMLVYVIEEEKEEGENRHE